MLSSVLLPVCQSLSDSNEVVRSAGLFALGQLSEHLQVSTHKRIHGIVHIVLFYLSAPLEQFNLGSHICIFFACFCYVYENIYASNRVMFSSQPDVSQYCADLMPLLLNYLSSLSQAKIGHVTKAFYALENFMENLGKIIDAVLNEC